MILGFSLLIFGIFVKEGLGQVVVPTPVWETMPGGGLRMWVDDQSGMTEVDIHFNINQPLPGVSVGQNNEIIRAPTGDKWIYEDSSIDVQVGDNIYFWILVIVNGEGYQNTEQMGTVIDGSPTTTTTTTSSTTTTTADQSVPQAHLEVLDPIGFRIWINDEPGMNEVDFHLNINLPLSGVDMGTYNTYLNSPTNADGEWSFEITDVAVDENDVIYYWYYVAIDMQGMQVTDQSWVPELAGTTTTTTPGGTGTTTSAEIPDIVSITESSEGILYSPGELIFEDNFDTLDVQKWKHEITLGGGGNWEFQGYHNHRNNSYVKDGVLYLKPTLTSDTYGEEFIQTGSLSLWGGQPSDYCTSAAFYGCERAGGGGGIVNPILSARLRTANIFSFMYGKVEVNAKMPVGDWIWPAIWMLPQKMAYGQWPASGEIDIVESRGNRNLQEGGTQVGVEQIGATLHYSGGYPENGFLNAHNVKQNSNGWDDDFHRYQLEWTPTSISIGVDDEEYLKVEPNQGGFWELGGWQDSNMENPWVYGKNPQMAPFDEQFYIVLNVAIGGTAYFSDEAVNGNGAKPWNNESPTAATDFWNGKDQWYPTWNSDENSGEDAAMKVDYVRVWASDIARG